MIKTLAISKCQVFPRVINYTDVYSYVFTLIFVSLAVATPWVFHQFHLAGPIFLPMHFFVLIAGLLFGWRAGLIVGLLTPIASYATSGMPAIVVLPQIVIETSCYGLVAGILREKFNLRVIWLVMGAMLGGRLALLLVLSTLYLVTGAVYSPLGVYEGMSAQGSFAAFWSTLALSWPGIAIQLVSIPLIMRGLETAAVKSGWGSTSHG